MDYSLPGSSVHGILQARILEWVAISFSRGSSRPRNRTWVCCIVGRFFTHWAVREASFLSTAYHFFFFFQISGRALKSFTMCSNTADNLPIPFFTKKPLLRPPACSSGASLLDQLHICHLGLSWSTYLEVPFPVLLLCWVPWLLFC